MKFKNLKKYTKDGAAITAQLMTKNAPKGTQYLAVPSTFRDVYYIAKIVNGEYVESIHD